MLPPWETGLDVNAVALALQDSSNTTPIAAERSAAMRAAGSSSGGGESDSDHDSNSASPVGGTRIDGERTGNGAH